MAFTQRKRDEFGMSWVFKEKYTAYFKENFPVQFAREQRWLQQKQLGGQQKNGETTAAAAVKSNADVSGAVNQDGQVTRVKTTNNSSEYDSADVDIIQSEIGGLKWALSGGGENAVELSSSLQKLRSIHERLQNSLAAISPIAAASSYTPGITVTNSSNADVSNLNSN
jgi:hypothetical protein